MGERGGELKILIAIPRREFDPTESAVPWKVLSGAGHTVRFATPNGEKGEADDRVLTGRGFGPLSPFMKAPKSSVKLYGEMNADKYYSAPIPYQQAMEQEFDGIIFPGGHAPGMKEYLESEILQQMAAKYLMEGRPVGAICHGVIIMARARNPQTGKSILYGRKTTALTGLMEQSAWISTKLWLGNYFKTYPQTVQEMVTRELEKREDFLAGPVSLRRDSADRPDKGFAVVDGNYISARWPGDAYRFATGFLEIAGRRPGK